MEAKGHGAYFFWNKLWTCCVYNGCERETEKEVIPAATSKKLEKSIKTQGEQAHGQRKKR
jgi:hypothetical protein